MSLCIHIQLSFKKPVEDVVEYQPGGASPANIWLETPANCMFYHDFKPWLFPPCGAGDGNIDGWIN